jgi:hypothetical protein
MGNNKFYHTFGVLTVAFAGLEADLRDLIAGIAFGDDSISASAFLDSSQLATNLRILSKISRRYWDKEKEFIEIIGSIEAIRETRNLFIHGLWHSRNFGEPNGFATVTDLKTTFKREDTVKKWAHSQSYNYSIDDFQALLDLINGAVKKIENLRKKIESEEGIQFGTIGFTAITEPEIISYSTFSNPEETQ